MRWTAWCGLGVVLAGLVVAPPAQARALAPVHVRVRSFDGVELDGWIQRPAVPAGVRVPVVLASGPYFGQEGDTADVDDVDVPRWLLDDGYAVAGFNVRGTGNSGGCFEFFGPDEQRDQAVLVDWLGSRSWSNGRVGMYGLSYLGTTPWEAAVQNPSHLKAIVAVGMVGDPYDFFHSPQGAPLTIGGAFATEYTALVSGNAPIFGGATYATVDHAPVLADRACPDVAKFLADVYTDPLTDDRDGPFWRARRLSDRFAGVRAAAFVVHGFQDLWTSGHAFQEDYTWRMLRHAPKRMLEGQWAHELPPLATWHATVRGWFDHWLKGIGSRAPGEGSVDYADGAGRWHRATAWPPAHRDEALYLSGDALRGTRGADARTFVSGPTTVSPDYGYAPELLCPVDAPGAPARQVVYATAPLHAAVHVAGNPFAYLSLTSTRPGGLVVVHLADLGPDFGCTGVRPSGYRMLTYGAADLRFHRGGYTATPFPTGTAAGVRIDLASLAETIEPGHRLALVVSSGDVVDRTSEPDVPIVAVGTPSHVVLPLVSGTLGGTRPLRSYPPNPFPGWVPS